MSNDDWKYFLSGGGLVAMATAVTLVKTNFWGSAKDKMDAQSSREKLTQDANEKVAAQLTAQLVALYAENSNLRDRWMKIFADWQSDRDRRDAREDELLTRALKAEGELAMATLKLNDCIKAKGVAQ